MAHAATLLARKQNLTKWALNTVSMTDEQKVQRTSRLLGLLYNVSRDLVQRNAPNHLRRLSLLCRRTMRQTPSSLSDIVGRDCLQTRVTRSLTIDPANVKSINACALGTTRSIVLVRRVVELQLTFRRGLCFGLRCFCLGVRVRLSHHHKSFERYVNARRYRGRRLCVFSSQDEDPSLHWNVNCFRQLDFGLIFVSCAVFFVI